MQILDHLLEREGVTLDCVHTSGHFDLHQQMAPENLAACFSLSMYLPHLHELNLYNDNKLLVFPIKDLTKTDRKSTRLNSSHRSQSRMPSSA